MQGAAARSKGGAAAERGRLPLQLAGSTSHHERLHIISTRRHKPVTSMALAMQGAAAGSKGGAAAERARLPLQLVGMAGARGAGRSRAGAGVERGRRHDAAPLDARFPPCPHLPRDPGER